MKKLATNRVVFALISVAVGFVLSTAHFAKADDVQDLQRQIEERNKNIAALESEIKLYQAEADKTSQKAKTLQTAILGLEQTGRKLDTDIKLTQAKISATDLNLNKLSLDIVDKQQRIINLDESVAESLRLMNQSDDFTVIESILGNKNLIEAFIVLDALQTIQRDIIGRTNDLKTTKEGLEVDKNLTEEQKEKLETFKQTLDGQRKVVVVNKNEQSSLLSTTKNSEAAYQKLIKDKAALKAQFEKELYDYEAKLKYTLDPSKLPTAGSSAFAWPVDSVYITQLFGKTSASGRLYASGSHNGVDLRALTGTAIKAMGNGTVIGTGDTDLACPRASFGRWVLIKYNNGLSAIFAHLSVISVKEGDAVKTGDIVAYSGNTGYSTGPHLHVGVYAADAVTVENRPSLSCAGKVFRMPISAVNAYLDPMLYWPKL